MNTSWTVFWFRPDDASPIQYHCMPDYDDREHSFDNCPCHPEIDEDGIYAHHSFDGREAFEEGVRLPS